jgi:hypothetical protein
MVVLLPDSLKYHTKFTTESLNNNGGPMLAILEIHNLAFLVIVRVNGHSQKDTSTVRLSYHFK